MVMTQTPAKRKQILTIRMAGSPYSRTASLGLSTADALSGPGSVSAVSAADTSVSG